MLLSKPVTPFYRWIFTTFFIPLITLKVSVAQGQGPWDGIYSLRSMGVSIELSRAEKGFRGTLSGDQFFEIMAEVRRSLENPVRLLEKPGSSQNQAVRIGALLEIVGKGIPYEAYQGDMERFVKRVQQALQDPRTLSSVKQNLQKAETLVRAGEATGSGRIKIQLPTDMVPVGPLRSSGKVGEAPSRPPLTPTTVHSSLYEWTKLNDGSRRLKFKIGESWKTVNFPAESKMRGAIGGAIADHKPSEVFDALAQKSTSLQIGWSMASFLGALVAYNEIKFLTQGEEQDPLARQRQWEELMTPEFGASLVPFGIYQYWYTTRYLGTNKVSALFGLGDKQLARTSFRNFMGQWSYGVTRMVPLVLVSAMIHQYGRYLRACNTYKEVNFQNSIENPLAGAPGLSDEKRQEALGICNAGFKIWSEEGLDTYGPLFLSGVATMGVMAALPIAGAAGARAGKRATEALGKTRLAEKLGHGIGAGAKVGRAGLTSLAAANQTSVYTINGLRLVWAGSRWTVGAAMGASGPFATALLAISVFDLSYNYISQEWGEARSATKVGKAERDLKTNMSFFANNNYEDLDNPCDDFSQEECLSTLHKKLGAVHKSHKKWRDHVMGEVNALLQSWSSYVQSFANRYRAAKIFYGDLFDQVQKKKTANGEDFSDAPLPLFTKSPLFGLGAPVYEPFSVMLSEAEMEEAEELMKTMEEGAAKDDLQKVLEDSFGGVVSDEQIQQREDGRKNGIRIANKEIPGLFQSPELYPRDRTLLEALSQAVSDNLEDFSAKASLGSAILQIQKRLKRDGITSYACEQNKETGARIEILSGCVLQAALELLGTPNPLGEGERYIRLANDVKLDSFGIDRSLFPGRYRGLKVHGMTEYLFYAALCGPDAEKKPDEIFSIEKGYGPEFSPPRLVDAPWGYSACLHLANEASLRGGPLGASGLNPFQTVFYSPDFQREYDGLVPVLFDHFSPQVLEEGFELWWGKRVEALVEPTVKDAESKFHSLIVGKLMNIANYGKKSALYDQEPSDSWWRAETDVPMGVMPSLSRELAFYLNDVLIPLGDKAEFANRKVPTGEDETDPQWVHRIPYQGSEKGYLQQITSRIREDFQQLTQLREDRGAALVHFQNLQQSLQLLKIAFQMVPTEYPGDPIIGEPLEAPFPFLYFKIGENHRNWNSLVSQTLIQVDAIVIELWGYHQVMEAFNTDNILMKKAGER